MLLPQHSNQTCWDKTSSCCGGASKNTCPNHTLHMWYMVSCLQWMDLNALSSHMTYLFFSLPVENSSQWSCHLLWPQEPRSVSLLKWFSRTSCSRIPPTSPKVRSSLWSLKEITIFTHRTSPRPKQPVSNWPPGTWRVTPSWATLPALRTWLNMAPSRTSLHTARYISVQRSKFCGRCVSEAGEWKAEAFTQKSQVSHELDCVQARNMCICQGGFSMAHGVDHCEGSLLLTLGLTVYLFFPP